MSTTLRNLMSRGGLSFAHLARGSRASDDDKDDDDSGKGKRSKRASDDEDDKQQDREDGDSKRGSRAEGDESDDDKDDDEDDDHDDGGKGKRSKRAADKEDDESADEDDDDEEEMRGNSAAANARRRERARCAAIFACKGAGRNPVLACKLAFSSAMPRSEAIEVLNGAPAAEGSRGRRQNPNLGIDSDRSVSSEQSIAASWDVAFQKAGAKRRR
ncbi:hypothetical protein LMG24238_06903 [Paraburkholderia sediminicola]|uniref:Uncharacterized protein n=1 Tax=Paraburkholderia sediminicola TaxID=458836 RepID=A0A6J5CRQ6_9BURK|nr:hypothetical protein LMG24238_06903 [Paraburkholderia sediminicola]